MFVARKLLSQQTRVCYEKTSIVTKMLVAGPASDSWKAGLGQQDSTAVFFQPLDTVPVIFKLFL